MLTRGEAKRLYDGVGAKQDKKRWYDGEPIRILLREGDFSQARSVFELGYGTGRIAQRMLERTLPQDARYEGVDISTTMFELASARLSPWKERAKVQLYSGSMPFDRPTGSYDRFFSTYVFDLLSVADIRAVLSEAHRMLGEGGLLCVAGLTPGNGTLTRLLSTAWSGIHALRPKLVGGCRPLRLADILDTSAFSLMHHQVVSTLGLSTEVLVLDDGSHLYR